MPGTMSSRSHPPSQGSNGVEFTKAESLSLPVITEMNGIYTLKTQS